MNRQKAMPAMAAARGVFDRARIKLRPASSGADNGLLALLIDVTWWQSPSSNSLGQCCNFAGVI
jgi:hypothetical protein